MQIDQFANREVLMIGSFLIFSLCALLYLIRQQRVNPLLNLTDLLTGDNGRYSSPKFFQAWAFVVTTWAFLWFCITGQAGEGLLLGYAGLWATAAAVNKQLSKSEPAQSTVVVTAPADTKVGVTTE